MKKIALLCNYELLPNRVGGMDYFFWRFDAHCKENGIQVDWFFPNTSTHGLYKGLNLYSSNYANVENYFLENHAHAEYSHIITHFIEICTPFHKKHKQKYPAKIIVVDHNPRPLAGYSLKKRIEKKVKGFLYAHYIDKFVGVSNYTVQELMKDFGTSIQSKTITLYNGVILDGILIREQRNFNLPRFLVASHLRKSKGIQDLIEALAMMQPEIRENLTIDVYGDGPFKTKLLELVKEKKVEQNLSFKGTKPNLKEIYYHYDYMLQPTHMECFSLSILESLAANVPVITTSVGGNEEAITHLKNGIIFKPKDCKALKTILEKIMKGELRITENTRNPIAERFSIEKMVENHFKLIS